jgi:hypothetical protein
LLRCCFIAEDGPINRSDEADEISSPLVADTLNDHHSNPTQLNSRTASVSALPLVIVVTTCCITQIAASDAQSANITESPQFGICEREAPRIVGAEPIKIGGRVRAPKKLLDVPPKYPDQADTTASGMWAGEVLIDAKGKISHVWTIREVNFKPPFPEFNAAIVEAIRQWEFEPTIIGNAATPVCMVVSMNINWK